MSQGLEDDVPTKKHRLRDGEPDLIVRFIKKSNEWPFKSRIEFVSVAFQTLKGPFEFRGFLVGHLDTSSFLLQYMPERINQQQATH